VADVAPIAGLTFDGARTALARTLAPPYDVLDAAGRAALAASPHNIVHVDLPTPDAAGYAAAAATLARWQDDGVLARAPRPSIYRYVQTFAHPLHGRTVARRAVVAGVRLSPYAARDVRPHERTLTGPKADRLALLRATRTQLSPVFLAHQDPAGEVERIMASLERQPPQLDVVDAAGVRHQLWACADAERAGRLRRALAPSAMYILDGHHRYETMLAYRDELDAIAPLEPDAAPNFGLACLVAADDPGLVVLPTYRLLHGLAGLDEARLLAAAAAGGFAAERVAGGGRDLVAARARLMERAAHAPTILAAVAGADDAVLLTYGGPRAGGVVGGLAVTILHDALLAGALGVDAAAQAAQRHLAYTKDLGEVARALETGAASAAFIVEPCALAEVMAVADAGQVLPQKSTYFVPKLASGVVMAAATRELVLR
jgi:uncharacterized protein (DUF1015 family)